MTMTSLPACVHLNEEHVNQPHAREVLRVPTQREENVQKDEIEDLEGEEQLRSGRGQCMGSRYSE